MKIQAALALAALCAVGPSVTRASVRPPASGDTVAFLGDSITYLGTTNGHGYVQRVLRSFRDAGIAVRPVFAGVSGDTCRQMRARLDRDVLSKRPGLVFFSDGVNDPPNGIDNPGVPLAEFKATYAEIVDRILASGARVVLLGPTPVVEGEHVANRNQKAYVAFIRAFAAERKLPLADMTALFDALYAKKADPKTRAYTTDGTHLNAAGNAHFANEVLKLFGLGGRAQK